MPKNLNLEGPSIQPLESVAGISQNAFRLTDLNSPTHSLTPGKSIEPIFIDKIGSGQVMVADEITGIITVGKLTDALRIYRDRLLKYADKYPDTTPEIKRLSL